MNLPTYDVKLKSEDPYTFDFISEGKNGNIQKVIMFQETGIEGVFNLGFGDKDPETGYLDDMSISDNGDTEKVLATVVMAVYLFTDENPSAYILAKDSTPARTRLYRRSITKYLEQAEMDFNIYGIVSPTESEFFIPNKEYEGFVIQRKKLYNND